MPPSLDPPPLVWALLGHRAGDNAQIRALAEALTWPVETKQLEWRRPWPLWSPLYGRRRSLAPLTPVARDALGPPWPDLVVAIGWRSVPVANWIAAQKDAAQVHLGRPRAPFEAFDLILTTPQYGLPPAPNVVRLPGPVGGPDMAAIAAAGDSWQPRLAHLPRPWIAVLVGGSAPPLTFGAADGARLGKAVSAMARAQGGTLLVATGPRTDPAAAAALTARIDGPAHLFRWDRPGDENPYLAYLALADAFVVTGDSISMMHEASRMARPLHVFPLRRRIPALLPPLDNLPGVATLRRQGLVRAPRRAEAFAAALIADGRAVRLGDPWSGPPPLQPPDPLDQAVRAVHEMMQRRH
ncbi:MAG: ELM1/GtrOC1 family putative glycosyltransferase [Pseudomonadota bacterium]